MSDDDLTTTIRAVLEAMPFHGEGHRKVWARLRFAGTRTSLRRVLRLMRDNDLLAPGRVGSLLNRINGAIGQAAFLLLIVALVGIARFA